MQKNNYAKARRAQGLTASIAQRTVMWGRADGQVRWWCIVWAAVAGWLADGMRAPMHIHVASTKPSSGARRRRAGGRHVRPSLIDCHLRRSLPCNCMHTQRRGTQQQQPHIMVVACMSAVQASSCACCHGCTLLLPLQDWPGGRWCLHLARAIYPTPRPRSTVYSGGQDQRDSRCSRPLPRRYPDDMCLHPNHAQLNGIALHLARKRINLGRGVLLLCPNQSFGAGSSVLARLVNIYIVSHHRASTCLRPFSPC